MKSRMKSEITKVSEMYNKYGAKKSCCHYGHKHDSKRESERCEELHLLQRAHAITNLQVQKKYTLIPPRKYNKMPNERGVEYIADFVYEENGMLVVEDCKGYRTKDYIIKRKMFKDKYCAGNENIIFIET